ncbi:hypothetical protein [Pseudochrobactrum sp. HB0163]|uniref:hypothetical protein n=1 Tax=Pseudochrobactrum sp. HB0163 TaxID=3450708 RepID=UPI003F6DAF5E
MHRLFVSGEKIIKKHPASFLPKHIITSSLPEKAKQFIVAQLLQIVIKSEMACPQKAEYCPYWLFSKHSYALHYFMSIK